ncbi:MAG: hypothetical protein KG003_05235 [Bacteroidetes bacterium]|nr:hypothetical protein [Bacteroidota bacterium]
MKTYFAPGKVMLCGEYTVTIGMECFALPVRAGQWLKVWESPSPSNAKIIWESRDEEGKVWFSARIDSDIFHVQETTDENLAKTIVSILREIENLKPGFFHHRLLRMELDRSFSQNDGLGSSSTLISLLSQWSQTDPFRLQFQVFSGSGYDIAVAGLRKPLIYWLEEQKPNWSEWKLNPDLTQNWWLLFPGKKMNSRESLASVGETLQQISSDPLLNAQLQTILQSFHNPANTAMLEAGLEMWQAILSNILQLPRAYDDLEIQPVKGGLCKWLGAWGGDVILVNETILDAYPNIAGSMNKKKWNEFVIAD